MRNSVGVILLVNERSEFPSCKDLISTGFFETSDTFSSYPHHCSLPELGSLSEKLTNNQTTVKWGRTDLQLSKNSSLTPDLKLTKKEFHRSKTLVPQQSSCPYAFKTSKNGHGGRSIHDRLFEPMERAEERFGSSKVIYVSTPSI